MFDEKYIDGIAFVLIMIQMMVYLNCTKHSFVFEGVLFFVIDCQVKCNTIREKIFEAPRMESGN